MNQKWRHRQQVKIYLIRHGMTQGNKQKRYIGTSDEPLCTEGIEEIKQREYPQADIVYASPLKRCIMTSQLIYPGKEIHICSKLREMDFGEFEGKNYEELKDNPAYIEWLESGGIKPFPGGESRQDFSLRCVEGFEECIRDCNNRDKFEKVNSVAFVVHGGTIMAIMEKYGTPKGEYYKWQVKNGEWLELEL